MYTIGADCAQFWVGGVWGGGIWIRTAGWRVKGVDGGLRRCDVVWASSMHLPWFWAGFDGRRRIMTDCDGVFSFFWRLCG